MTKKITTLAKPLGSESVASRIVTQITDLIIAGSLKPGDKLPTEPDLCTAFNVGRNSVREAIKILEAYGIVYIKRAEGTFINDAYSQKMLNPMLYGILLEENFGGDIIQLRKILDIGILYTAVCHITKEHLFQLKNSLSRLSELIQASSCDSQALFQADVDFHMALAEAAQNHLLLSMYSYVDKITSPSRMKTIEFIITTDKLLDFLELHEKIVQLVEQKDLTKIESTLTEHYQFWNQIM